MFDPVLKFAAWSRKLFRHQVRSIRRIDSLACGCMKLYAVTNSKLVGHRYRPLVRFQFETQNQLQEALPPRAGAQKSSDMVPSDASTVQLDQGPTSTHIKRDEQTRLHGPSHRSVGVRALGRLERLGGRGGRMRGHERAGSIELPPLSITQDLTVRTCGT
jgi:hypothetical protein